MKILCPFLLLCISLNTYAQTDEEEAYKLGMEAVKEMESGNSKEAIKLLKKAEKLDPENPDYPYEIAFAHYLDEDYKKAIKILKDLLDHKDVNGRVYQMLGNCQDLNGDPEKAIDTYEKGLELFPNSGELHLERGNMALKNEEFNNALALYENGISVDPKYPSNYYWASRIYLSSKQEVWGLIYGEIFMNLERNSERTAQISKLLHDTYKSEIKIESDTSLSVSFCNQMTMSIEDLQDTANLKLPFCMIFEPTFMLSMGIPEEININTLDVIRTRFITNYFKKNHHKDYPNILYEFRKEVNEKGHAEAYNHWILMKGDEDKFKAWYEENTEKWNSFLEWFKDNPLEVNETRNFSRFQY